MGLYIGLFVLFAAFSYVELFTRMTARTKRILQLIVIGILLTLTSIRAGYTGDYIQYKNSFDRVDVSVFYSKINFNYEPLYCLIRFLTKIIFNNYQAFIFIIGLITVILECNYAKQLESSIIEKDPGSNGKRYFFTIMFILLALYMGNIYVIRQTIAMLVCMNGVIHIERRNLLKFVGVVAIAACFHYSAIIFLPAYFIYHVHAKLRDKIILALFILAVLTISLRYILFFMSNNSIGRVLARNVAYYLSDITAGMASGLRFNVSTSRVFSIANLFVILFIISYLWKFLKNDRQFEGYANLYFVAIALYIITLSINSSLGRLASYYLYFQVPILLHLFLPRMKSQKVYWIVMVTYIFARYYLNLINGEIQVPFITIWDNY